MPDPSPFADNASAAAKTGNDSIVVEFTAIVSGAGATGVVAERVAAVSTQTIKSDINFEAVMVR